MKFFRPEFSGKKRSSPQLWAKHRMEAAVLEGLWMVAGEFLGLIYGKNGTYIRFSYCFKRCEKPELCPQAGP